MVAIASSFLRACLTSLNTPAGGSFAAMLRYIFLKYTQYSGENLPCLAAKFLVIRHASRY
jgi:hypothetical protein